jgi:uncharacterized damage-inducible protein DinB
MKNILSFLIILSSLSSPAQNSLGESVKDQMIKDWERAKAYTQEYLDAMPADKYSFRPVDSVRNFAAQMLHLAYANAGMVFIATGAPYPFRMGILEKSPSAQSKDSVMYFVNSSYDFAISAIKNLDVSRYSEVVSWDLPGGKRTAPRLVWLMKGFEHQSHHRGQCTVYLRLVGVRPPSEMLW